MIPRNIKKTQDAIITQCTKTQEAITKYRNFMKTGCMNKDWKEYIVKWSNVAQGLFRPDNNFNTAVKLIKEIASSIPNQMTDEKQINEINYTLQEKINAVIFALEDLQQRDRKLDQFQPIVAETSNGSSLVYGAPEVERANIDTMINSIKEARAHLGACCQKATTPKSTAYGTFIFTSLKSTIPSKEESLKTRTYRWFGIK